MQKEEVSYTFYVLAGFILLFLVFTIVQPKPETTGLISLNLDAAGGKLPLVIIGVTAILALGLALMSYKHFKKKKAATPSATPSQSSQQALTNEELTQLFPENQGTNPNATSQPSSSPAPTSPLATPQPATQQTPPPATLPLQQTKQQSMTSLQDIKAAISTLLAQGQTRQQILEQLQARGFTAPQIIKAVDELNLERLIAYIKNALSQGFKNEQITKILLESGWQQDAIDKAFSSQ